MRTSSLVVGVVNIRSGDEEGREDVEQVEGVEGNSGGGDAGRASKRDEM